MGKRIVVIGGGPSGLMAAIQAARRGATVTLLEGNDKPGRKLLVTGNGRCNMTNLSQDPTCYRSKHPDFAWSIIRQFPVDQTIAFFSALGIYTKNRDGWIYPNSDQASSVLQVLLMEAASLGIKIKTRERVLTVRKVGEEYLSYTTTWKYRSDAVILACGSPASAIEGASDSVMDFAEAFGHRMIPFQPALVPMRAQGHSFSKWTGVRIHARVTLLVRGQNVAEETGEVQLTEYGISGIPVFQLSRYAACALAKHHSVLAQIDFLPGFTKETLHTYLEWRMEQCPYKTLQQSLIGLIPEKLIPLAAPFEADISQTVSFLKEYPLIIKEPASVKQAQVCSGGVDTAELTQHLESIHLPGLYFVGEAVDVDGRCGGYNLQWAWSSGALAGIHSSEQQ